MIDYRTLGDFLADFANAKRKVNPRWTYAVWSRQLGIKRLATLTRVIHGARSPAEPTIRALIEYFGFDPVRQEYFRSLVRISRRNVGEELLRLLRRRLGELSLLVHRSSPRSPGGDDLVLALRDGRVLGLWGHARLASANDELAALHLEAVPMQGRAYVGLVAAEYPDTSLGPYSEFYLAILAKKRERSVLDAGVLFQCLVNSSPRLATVLRMHWGLDYSAGTVRVSFADAEVTAEGRDWIRLSLGDSPFPFSPNRERAVLRGISTGCEALKQYKLCLSGDGRRRAYDPARDGFEPGAGTDLSALLSRIHFSPSEWTFFERMSCDVFPPVDY